MVLPDVRYVCGAHLAGNVVPHEPSHVLFQLRSEGHKRVESFIFERLFARQVKNHLSEGSFAFGWWVHLMDGTPRYWVKLEADSSPWNECDRAIQDFAEANDGEVIRVFFDTQQAKFLTRYGHDDATPEPLSQTLASLLGTNRQRQQPRNFSGIDRNRQAQAIDWIGRKFSKSELAELAISRLLINCHLDPWLGKAPMDLDAAVLTSQGLRFVEFKRKYPANDGMFGIDLNPHCIFGDWLNARGQSLLHVILCDPLWRRDTSPLHLLLNDTTAPYARWLGVEISAEAFSDGHFSTYGIDSGMYGGNRRQRKIKSDSLRMIGHGLECTSLGQFLEDPSSTNPVAQDELLNAREASRKAYQGEY